MPAHIAIHQSDRHKKTYLKSNNPGAIVKKIINLPFTIYIRAIATKKPI
ncbi:MAG: hypothetical protein F6K23_10060 [Okeania sp. SIO2C9]|nr:hypothetical protein [Okeania sp. SIO2C9]NEQ73385.1 hypothetical protein [Okeania sp. SIO2C9]